MNGVGLDDLTWMLPLPVVIPLFAAGLALAAWAVNPLLALTTLPRSAEVSLDLSVALFTLSVSVITGVGFGLAPLLMLSRSAFGRWLYASGGNERAAELSGVPVRLVKITVYTISGALSAVAGLVLASQLTSAGPTAGTTYELTAIAAVVIGGAALTGGRGGVRGTMLGAFVIGFLSAGLVIIGVSSYWQTVFTGAVIVLAVLMNSIQYGRGGRKS